MERKELEAKAEIYYTALKRSEHFPVSESITKSFIEGYQQALEESKWQALKEFLYLEIINRREYSASKSFEVVLEEMNRLFPNPKEKHLTKQVLPLY